MQGKQGKVWLAAAQGTRAETSSVSLSLLLECWETAAGIKDTIVDCRSRSQRWRVELWTVVVTDG